MEKNFYKVISEKVNLDKTLLNLRNEVFYKIKKLYLVLKNRSEK